MNNTSTLEQSIKTAATMRAKFTHESAEYNFWDNKISAASDELRIINANSCPLVTDLATEKAWFNSQGFTGADLQKANAACRSRGYALCELQSACKSA